MRRASTCGKSLAEKDMADTARRILAKAEDASCAIILPVDAIVAFHFQANAPSHAYGLDAIPRDGMVLDIGSPVDRAHQGRDRRRRDAGLERPARRVRDAAVRHRHRGGRALRRRAHQEPASSSRSRAAATRSRRSTTRTWPTSSPTCRPPAARSSNGWRAASCPASRRCGRRARASSLVPAKAGTQFLALGTGFRFRGYERRSTFITPAASSARPEVSALVMIAITSICRLSALRAELRLIGLRVENLDPLVGNDLDIVRHQRRALGLSRQRGLAARVRAPRRSGRRTSRCGRTTKFPLRAGTARPRRHALRSRAACRAPCR